MPTDDLLAARLRQERQVVGARILALRHQRGLSQERLGELAGSLDRRTVARMERGAQASTIDQLNAVAWALGVETWRLFWGD
ncbi:helix-turn-helix transcriptional regulator [Streptomyces sp. CB03911]|uniref:helix-turn-helix domain-containing protein n=1 Tax=Streptomyces sp. CB03911 TaxID=1804758 RepID=UPI00093EE838|nr:helix-turn-helix transcriptional regulator [Streptomyces sp. CB03911]OKI22184.1 hypothetical protein A6A07_34480 [Streptomyces sp. CB03911]